MSDTAFKTQYRDEYIASFEQTKSYLVESTTTEAVINGNSAVFLVAGTGGNSAVTRGVNGLIPANANDLTQNTCTLAEWHDLRRMTAFNIFASQGNQRAIMQRNSLAVVNRKRDADILAALETGTQDTGGATTASLDLVMYGVTILGNNAVEMDGNISAVISPAFHAYLMQTKEFASVDYVSNKRFDGNPMAYRWAGVNFIVHPNITGKATTAEKCIMYHRAAIGHAFDNERIDVVVGYEEEQAYSFARSSGFFGSKLLQNAGIVIMNHDGSAYAAQ